MLAWGGHDRQHDEHVGHALAPDLRLEDGSTLTDHATSASALVVGVDGPTGLRDVAARWTDRLKAVSARPPDHTDWAGVALVRPDGYIAWASSTEPTLATVENAISALLGPPGT